MSGLKKSTQRDDTHSSSTATYTHDIHSNSLDRYRREKVFLEKTRYWKLDV